VIEDEFEIVNGVRIPYGFGLLEPRQHLDKAICAFEDVVVYDWDLLIDAYMTMGWSYEECSDWICYNTDHNGYYYCGEKSPKIRNNNEEEESSEE
jgi:hypothetical protein